MSIGTVYLVGAGCGAADLITVRGRDLLERCDAVLYDDLIDPALLALPPASTQRIYMGKRSGRHSAPQDEICAALIRLAQEGKTVVRLKGGDPYVFGRGGEEMLALLEAGVPCEVVPGVTSAVAIPAEAGIPVTHRHLSRSVHIITAHTADTPDGLPTDLEHLAKLQGTLVFLMGLGQLPKLAARLLEAGMVPETPAAVLSGGKSPHPAAVHGTLSDIAEKARDIHPPAVIVIGAAAEMDLRSHRPLEGVTVAVTGTDAILEKLENPLLCAGAHVFRAQRSQVAALDTPFDLERLAAGERWLVFTSANGVDLFFARLKEVCFDLRRLHQCRFAVIGPGTGKRLASFGIQPDLCPEVYTTEALGQALLETVSPGTPIHLLRSAGGSVPLREILEAKFPVEDIPLYALQNDEITVKAAVPRLPHASYITFSSASGVELFFAAHGALPPKAIPVCIGPISAATLRRRYDGPMLVAPEATAGSLVRTILEDIKK